MASIYLKQELLLNTFLEYQVRNGNMVQLSYKQSFISVWERGKEWNMEIPDNAKFEPFVFFKNQ